MDLTYIFFAGISDPLKKEAIEKCPPWKAKKKNWGTIRALPPTTSTSFMDLDLCTRDGGQIADQQWSCLYP